MIRLSAEVAYMAVIFMQIRHQSIALRWNSTAVRCRGWLRHSNNVRPRYGRCGKQMLSVLQHFSRPYKTMSRGHLTVL